jgi:hypothetical protein
MLLTAEQSGHALIVFRDELGSLCFRDVPSTEAIQTIGRGTETDLSIPWDGEVSRVHAMLQNVGGELTVIDDGLSTNGTFVNGGRVKGRQRLRDGDRVRVGRTVLVYRGATVGPDNATVASRDHLDAPQLTDTQRRILIALCRPLRDGAAFAMPATNRQIAAEVYLGVDAVKMHLRGLFAKFGLGDLPQNQKRVRLAECVLRLGVITTYDLG